MNKLDLNCPRCAAIMTPDASGEHAVCEYCGHQMIIEKKVDPEELRRRQEAKSYGYHAGKYKAEEEAQARERKRGRVGLFIFLAVFFAIGAIGLAVTFFTQPKLEDPFAYLEVTFTGEDGDGEMEMKVINNAPDGIDMAHVNFSCEKKHDLSEGDIIVIEASSIEYRLGTTSKRYTVEGLECYLKDVQALDERQLETFFLSNKEIQVNNAEYVLQDGEDLNITPLRIVCYNSGTENEIFLISEVKYQVSSKTYYAVSNWDDVIVGTANGSIRLSGGTYTGELVTVDSPWCAMLFEDFEAAVKEVEGCQDGNEEASVLDIK